MGFLIRFFLRNGLHSKRTIWLCLLGLVPVVFGAVLWLLHPVLMKEGISVPSLFPRISFFFFLHFLLPLLSVFVGASIIADEVEDRTLPYLMVRPLPRPVIILGKAAASVISSAVILLVSLVMTYAVMMLRGGMESYTDYFPRLMKSAGVLLLGLMAYVSLFGLLGGVLKRPVLAGLLFSFGWENMVAFFPGNIKFFTVVHYLHVLFPRMAQVQSQDIRTAILTFIMPTKTLPAFWAVFILVMISAVFAAGMAFLLNVKEYRLEQA